MNILVWSDTSFEKPYASYHLMQGIIDAMINKNNSVWLVQCKWFDGILPEMFLNYDKLHVVNIPQTIVEKTSFAKRYISTIKYFRESKDTVRDIIKKHSIDVIFLQSTNAAFFPVRYAKRWSIPIVYNVQDIFPLDATATGMLKKSNPAFYISRAMQRYAYKKATKVITISKDLAKTIHDEGRKEVEIVYNWTYQNTPFIIEDTDNHFLNSYKIERADGFRVVYAGNIGKMMNADMIINTAKYLSNNKDIKFYIIGEGSNLAYMKERKEAEMLENILFFPSQPMEYAADNYCMADMNIIPVPKGVIYTCMPSKTNTCLLSLRPTVISMDLDSDMAQRLSGVDLWRVVEPNDYLSMAEAILQQYKKENWDEKSCNAGDFMNRLGPTENAYKYVSIIESAAREIR